MKKKLCTVVAVVICLTMLLSALSLVASVADIGKADPFVAFSQSLSFDDPDAKDAFTTAVAIHRRKGQ